MWFFIFLAAIVASLIGICYVSVCISKFGIFQSLISLEGLKEL